MFAGHAKYKYSAGYKHEPISVNPRLLWSVFKWRHKILKSKTKEWLKVLSSSRLRGGTKIIPACSFPAKKRHSVKNQRILNFGVIVGHTWT